LPVIALSGWVAGGDWRSMDFGIGVFASEDNSGARHPTEVGLVVFPTVDEPSEVA
jgi:hypothetical protein